jgi:hypothetical protein
VIGRAAADLVSVFHGFLVVSLVEFRPGPVLFLIRSSLSCGSVSICFSCRSSSSGLRVPARSLVDLDRFLSAI